VDPVPDPLLLRKSGSAGEGIEPETSVSEARNSDHWTTEAVTMYLLQLQIVKIVYHPYKTN
jgi:hypothetical protein